MRAAVVVYVLAWAVVGAVAATWCQHVPSVLGAAIGATGGGFGAWLRIRIA